MFGPPAMKAVPRASLALPTAVSVRLAPAAVPGSPLNNASVGTNAGFGLFSDKRTRPPVPCVKVNIASPAMSEAPPHCKVLAR